MFRPPKAPHKGGVLSQIKQNGYSQPIRPYQKPLIRQTNSASQYPQPSFNYDQTQAYPYQTSASSSSAGAYNWSYASQQAPYGDYGIVQEYQSTSQESGYGPRFGDEDQGDMSMASRDYRCGCGKTYAAYNGLFAHVKNKHRGIYPPGTLRHRRDIEAEKRKLVMFVDFRNSSIK